MLLSGGVQSLINGVGVTKAVTVDVSPKQIGFNVSSVAPNEGVVLTLMYWLIVLSFLQPSGNTDVFISQIFKLAI